MKSLNEFIDDLSKDKKLAAKFKSISDPAEVVKQAQKEGYEFTEDDYMDKQMEAVAGGINVFPNVSPCVEGPQRTGWKFTVNNLIGPTGKK